MQNNEISSDLLCEIIDGVEKNEVNISFVEYYCIGNETVPDGSELTEIQGGNNLNNELLNGINPTKENSTFNTLPTSFIIENNTL